MNSKVYKWCAVPQCKNTSIKTPSKLFVYVPNKQTIRNKWLSLARRDPTAIRLNSSIYFCEDHFDLPNDMENYMKYHVMGLVSQVRMKPGCIPTKFECQPDRRKRTSNTTERPYIFKKKRILIEECEKDLEERKHLEVCETSPGSLAMEAETGGGIQPKQEPIEEVDQPIDVTTLYSGHEIKDELVIGPVVLQKTYIGVNSQFADIGTDQNRVCFSLNQRSGRSEQSESKANYTTQLSDSTIKVEPQVVDGDDRSIREGAFGSLNVTSVAEEHSGVHHAWSSDDPYKLEFTVDNIKEKKPPAEAQPNTQNDEEDCLGTLHMTRDESNIASEDTITPFSCNICNKQYSQNVCIKPLPAVHAIEKPFSCDICKKQFGHKSYSTTLLVVHTKEKPFSCDICNKQFGKKSDIKRHSVVHTKEKPFSCHICNKQFSHNSHLKIHLAVHMKGKPFSCDICNKQFGQKCSLKAHLVVHTKEKPFSCDICNKQFGQKGSLKAHSVVHTKQKPFSCDICNKQFGKKCDINRHLMIHTKEKAFSCDMCNKQFCHKSNLKIHLAVHMKEKPFSCDICCKQFCQKRSLKTHVMVHTEDIGTFSV